jgi:hypothetical protein
LKLGHTARDRPILMPGEVQGRTCRHGHCLIMVRSCRRLLLVEDENRLL